MAKLQESYIFQGMQRDLSVSKHPTQFVYDAKNIRLTARESDTLMSITNERGTLETNITINGSYLGHCLLNEYLIVFSTTSTNRLADGSTSGLDYITKINLKDETSIILYNSLRGNLGFCITDPIEAIASYENLSIQKVYWTDGFNQPRIINIVAGTSDYTPKSFDFIQDLALQEKVTVTKLLGANGEFPPGVIQYALTYYNKYGQETNIFYTTPLSYISFKDRAGSPESKVQNAFRITVKNPDRNFDYMRIYSILRTSINSTPIVKRVQDILVGTHINDTPTVIDDGYIKIIDHLDFKASMNKGVTFLQIMDFQEAAGIKVHYSYLHDTMPVLHTYSFYWAGDYVYVFKKSDFPNLILKAIDPQGNLNQYTWGDDTNDTAILYWTPTALFCLSEQQVDGVWERASINVYSGNVAVGDSISFIDTNYGGESVDPVQLLYLGGEEVSAKTIEQKDGTLFLGNLTVKRPTIPKKIKETILSDNSVSKSSPIANHKIQPVITERPFLLANKLPFSYINTLSGPETEEYQGAACFKSREYYRLGVQFQYKNGKWSEPCWIGDKQCSVTPLMDEGGDNHSFSTKGIGVLALPEFTYNINGVLLRQLYSLGYRKVRGLFIQPGTQDRTIICQGVAAPTVFRSSDNLYAQSSWLFRTKSFIDARMDCWSFNTGGRVSWDGYLRSQYKDDVIVWNPDGDCSNFTMAPYFTTTEVMGIFDDSHTFQVKRNFFTLHSPDVQFDESMANMDFKDCAVSCVGFVPLESTYGDIEIQTSTPAIGSDSAGFVHRSIETSGDSALISGLFYNDYLVDDWDDNPITYHPYNTSSPPVDWPIYMWHKNGSLNNDVSRPNRSAELLKKRISNYRRGGNTTFFNIGSAPIYNTYDVKLFNSDVLQIIKLNGSTYQGNIDTMLIPTTPSPFYFVGSPWRTSVDTGIWDRPYYRLKLKDPNNTDSKSGVWVWENRDGKYMWWSSTGEREDIGTSVKGLDQWREGISMKYKSTPHLVCDIYGSDILNDVGIGQLPLVEIYRTYDSVKNTIFGGTSDDALQAATWIPCGPPVAFDSDSSNVTIPFKWGDSYYQRFECLKTYPFTTEDKNQVIEIASFMCETRVNADGRYDKNRGQKNNLNMSPQNFNLWNPVYSQMDNFFTYKILDPDYYNINGFPNQITWSKEKKAGAEIDLWTNVTLASTYDMDGSKGEITCLNTWKDQIFCFQNKGVSNILFNSRVQIPTSDGLPIEITNNYKVDGYRYISDGIGCLNKSLIKETPSGIYFIDSIGGHLMHISDSLKDLSEQCNMTKWFKDYADSISKIAYDNINHDVYLIRSNDNTLCFSEKLNQFTGFYDYNGINLVETYNGHVFTMQEGGLWKMFEGNYNNFFGTNKPWYLTFISNGIGNNLIGIDKTFTNLEFRANVDGDGSFDEETGNFIHRLPFDSLETWNEYQHGYTVLENKCKKGVVVHGKDNSILQRKFRIWRCDIPRNNCQLEGLERWSYPYSPDSELGISRYSRKLQDRMRNPWIYLKLSKNASSIHEDNFKTEIHDIQLVYFS